MRRAPRRSSCCAPGGSSRSPPTPSTGSPPTSRCRTPSSACSRPSGARPRRPWPCCSPTPRRPGRSGSRRRPPRLLAERFWPGGLTLVLPVRPDVTLPGVLAAGTPTIGVRVPDHAAPRALAAALGPLPTTSANLSGQPDARDAAEVAATLGEAIALVIDGGPIRGGPASTVVDCTTDRPAILRSGAIDPSVLAEGPGRGRDPARARVDRSLGDRGAARSGYRAAGQRRARAAAARRRRRSTRSCGHRRRCRGRSRRPSCRRERCRRSRRRRPGRGSVRSPGPVRRRRQARS